MSLPNGLTIDPNAGIISGLPSTPGSYSFTAQAQDAKGEQFSVQLTLTILPPPSFVGPTTLPNAEVGVPYSYTLSCNGGTSPYYNFQVMA